MTVSQETKKCQEITKTTSTKSVNLESNINSKVKTNGSIDKKPFESFQNCLFSIFTSCVAWSCMRRVYWRQNSKVGWWIYLILCSLLYIFFRMKKPSTCPLALNVLFWKKVSTIFQFNLSVWAWQVQTPMLNKDQHWSFPPLWKWS